MYVYTVLDFFDHLSIHVQFHNINNMYYRTKACASKMCILFNVLFVTLNFVVFK